MLKRQDGAVSLDKMIRRLIMTKQTSKKLMRIPSKGKVAGVCAGLAEFTGIETWLIRVIWFSGIIFSGGFFIVAYIAAWFILDKDGSISRREGGFQAESTPWAKFENEIDKAVHVKRNVYQSGEPPVQAFRDIKRQFDGIEQRIRGIETYVTSNEFTLKREINKL